MPLKLIYSMVVWFGILCNRPPEPMWVFYLVCVSGCMFTFPQGYHSDSAELDVDVLSCSFLGFSVDKVGDLSFLLKALSYRERVLQRSLAARLYAKVSVTVGPLSEGLEKKKTASCTCFQLLFISWWRWGGLGWGQSVVQWAFCMYPLLPMRPSFIRIH